MCALFKPRQARELTADGNAGDNSNGWPTRFAEERPCGCRRLDTNVGLLLLSVHPSLGARGDDAGAQQRLRHHTARRRLHRRTAQRELTNEASNRNGKIPTTTGAV